MELTWRPTKQLETQPKDFTAKQASNHPTIGDAATLPPSQPPRHRIKQLKQQVRQLSKQPVVQLTKQIARGSIDGSGNQHIYHPTIKKIAIQPANRVGQLVMNQPTHVYKPCV